LIEFVNKERLEIERRGMVERRTESSNTENLIPVLALVEA
jgi:hypothetical protein